MSEVSLVAALGPLRGIELGVARVGEHSLLEEEAAAVANAVATRRADFAAGRAAARIALSRVPESAEAGTREQAIPRGARGAPMWPANVVGSISHAGGIAVAALARTHEIEAIGVDIEVAAPLPSEVAAMVVTVRDRLDGAPPPLRATLAFSAKEAVYKALYPLRGWLLEFADVALDVHSDGSFVAEARWNDALERVPGRWALVGEMIATLAIREAR